ncbi:MAG TPA: DinB family protein [Candidatus Kapabacteria bacterium]|nr:DinB family protein [Candidatus Kapabacteria bacterium]
MTEYFKQILLGQYEASLAMMKQRIEACPPEHWEGKVGADTFRQITYHALFCLDLYLSSNYDTFVFHDLYQKGGDEREDQVSPGLSKDDTLVVVERCHGKILESLASETQESLQGESGFSWRKEPRAELHIYNIRHFQHHVGQLSTYLRKVSDEHNLSLKLPWFGSGWK